MNTEPDFDLTAKQWETLKALRRPAPVTRPVDRLVVEGLMALGLVSTDDGSPVITARGRHILIRGSSRLLDVAA